MTTLATANWTQFGDYFYRRYELYSMVWSPVVGDLSLYKIAAAPFGGPVALLKKDLNAKYVSGATHPELLVFSASGQEISRIKWINGPLLHFDWTVCERLVCVQTDGKVFVYSLFGETLGLFHVGSKDYELISCQIVHSYAGTALVALTAAYKFILIQNIDNIKGNRTLADVPGLTSPPSSWCIINQGRSTQLLVAVSEQLFLMDSGGNCERQTPDIKHQVSAYTEMAVSSNHRYVALMTAEGYLCICTSDLRTVFCEFQTKYRSRPQQLVWCGNGAVACYWDHVLHMAGTDKGYLTYQLPPAAFLVQEPDGVRILGPHTHDFIQKVPEATESIYKIGSLSPAAILFEAADQFKFKDKKANEYLRSIRDHLEEAVDECIQGAGYEYESKNQKTLLRAASFGKSFLPHLDPSAYVTMGRMLRILNSVRCHSIGMPLTFKQLQLMTFSTLVDRLVGRRHFELAIQICRYLKQKENETTILFHWACQRVSSRKDGDDSIAKSIRCKLGESPGIPYSRIARKALELSKRDLAVKLLEFESQAKEQVPLLMEMESYAGAMAKAIDSWDSNLVYEVLFRWRDTMEADRFLMEVRQFHYAQGLYKQYCEQDKPDFLQNIYDQEDSYQDLSICLIKEWHEKKDKMLHRDCLTRAAHNFTRGKCDLDAKATQEEVQLLEFQKHLRGSQLPGDVVKHLGAPLHSTINWLLRSGEYRATEQLRKEYKVTDRRLWWLKVSAFASIGDWHELDKLSKVKRSPIGYEPFVTECFKAGNIAEALKYIPKVAQDYRVRCLAHLEKFELAAEEAINRRSREDIEYVLQKGINMDRHMVDKLQNCLARLD